jgi:hypothetical protein
VKGASQFSTLTNQMDVRANVVDGQISTLRSRADSIEADIADLENRLSKIEGIVGRMTSSTCSGANTFSIGYDDDGSVICRSVQLPDAAKPPIVASKTPSASKAPTKTASAEVCTASPAICRVYKNELGRVPDKGGAMFYQDYYDKLMSQGYSPTAAENMVAKNIAGSNEALGRQETFADIQQRNEFAKAYKIDNRLQGCAAGTNCNVGGTQNAVKQTYREVLGRAADTKGAAFWEGQVKSGNVNANELTGYFQRSNEGAQNAIDQIYSDVLGREADAAGAEFWKGKITSGELTADEVRQQIANSPEAQGK